MKRLIALAMLLLAAPAFGQGTGGGSSTWINNTDKSAPVDIRCMDALGVGYESCGGSISIGSVTSDGIIRDGAGAGQADVIGIDPTGAEQALVTRNIPSGTQAVSGPLTDAQLRAAAVLVDVGDRVGRLLGHVTVDNASIAVTGTFWQVTQPVSGPLTDTQLRASAVVVSATAWPLPTNAAQETGGNLATLAGKDFATAAKQDTGNTSLGTIKTNTDPLVTSGAGGYVRQDSTATIAKESGGNLATLVTNTTSIATAARQDTGNTSLASIDAKLSTATGSTTTIVVTQLTTTLLSSSATRNGWRVCNNSPDALFVKYGTAASVYDFSQKVDPMRCAESQRLYTGDVTGVWWPGTSGQAVVTDLQ